MTDAVTIHSRYFLAASSVGLAIFSLLAYLGSGYIGGAAFFEKMGGMDTSYWLIGWLGLSAVSAYLLNPRRLGLED